MAQVDSAQPGAALAVEPQNGQPSLWKRIFGPGNGSEAASETTQYDQGQQQIGDENRPGIIRRVSRKVVPGLPRAQTFKRQQAEVRNNLEPVQPTRAERRAVSVDRRLHPSRSVISQPTNPRTSAPEFLKHDVFSATVSAPSRAGSVMDEKMLDSIGELTMADGIPDDLPHIMDAESFHDTVSITTSQYDSAIHEELERIWILNLSMHFRDKSKREKFFVTYREKDVHWRRVTVSLDYRSAPDSSLEMELLHTKLQRDKSAKIYEAIRESLRDIQFYETVTNLKLQTTDGRLHVHVVEDVNEIIHYPTVRMIQHLRCRRVMESQIDFEAHMSGFVYKVRIDGETLIKKEIPGPDTVDEFLYEINALSQLYNSRNVIRFYGVIVDDYGEHVKGLLISFAEQGALIDVIYDHDRTIPWIRREKWARQIVEGLSEIHEAGFVQGDFTLSNIVIDDDDNAKIIDINRRGCPVGWEPPEATPLIESNQRISMYIGVKSDLYQLGMVLWALAEQEDEPETHGRPLTLREETEVPDWYRTLMSICLAENPRNRLQAIDLLRLFPHEDIEPYMDHTEQPPISVDDGYLVQEFIVRERETSGGRIIRTVQEPENRNHRSSFGYTYVGSPTGLSSEPYYYPTRGRSPPSPIPSNLDLCEPRWAHQDVSWTGNRGRSFERKRSVSGFEFSPVNMTPDNGEQNRVFQHQEDAFQSEKTDEQPTEEAKMTEDDFVTPTQENPNARRQENGKPREEPIQVNESPGEPQAQMDIEGKQEPAESGPEIFGHQESMNPQDDVLRSPGVGVNINANTKSPLFQEAGITEPEAPRTIALVSCAAKVQKNKSASPVLDTKQSKKDERVDSAIEMSPTATLPRMVHRSSKSSNTKFPDDLLCLGAGHDHADDVAARRGSGGDIDEADLANT